MTELLNNRYKIIRKLGQGGSGQTYLAEDTYLPSSPLRVIKQLKPTSTDPEVYRILKQRFDREAAILEKLGDDNEQIPKLYAYFAENQEFYLVQDWIDGNNLAEEYRDKGLFTKTAVCEVLASLLTVLEFVHARGIIHRDIKPENVMIRRKDRKPFLIDFGAVKEVVTASVDSHGNPTSSVIIGTPGYMPLEQLNRTPVFSSDLYALGLTAIFLLTGKNPQQIRDQVTGDLSWRQYAGNLDPELVSVLDKATEKLTRDRYKSASEMNQAVRKLFSNKKKIEIPVPPRPVKRFAVPKPLLYVVACVAVVVVLGAMAYAVHLYQKSVAGANPQPVQSSCVLFNDDSSQQTVNVRSNCDTKSCDLDPSTILKEYPNSTPIRVNREITVKSRKGFDWTQIVIIGSGEVVWVASSKIRCN
jgi:serine/threonine-protein kinase